MPHELNLSTLKLFLYTSHKLKDLELILKFCSEVAQFLNQNNNNNKVFAQISITWS